MASFRRALPSLARCERPSRAFSRFFRDQPGRLAQGPEEKCVLTGRLAGLCAVVISLSFQIDAPRWGGVARGGNAGKAGKCQETGENADAEHREQSNSKPATAATFENGWLFWCGSWWHGHCLAEFDRGRIWRAASRPSPASSSSAGITASPFAGTPVAA